MPTVPARRLLELHAHVCQALANPTRLQILDLLRDGERSVAALTAALRLRKANVSQHLAVLRARGIVAARRDGQTVHYRLTTPDVTRACDLMRRVLIANLEQQRRLVRRAGVRERGAR